MDPGGIVPTVRLPDFIIGGAAKCATTTLHQILAKHPDIGIPDQELHFFDADDPVAHPDFQMVDKHGLVAYDCNAFAGPLFDGYAKHFEPFTGKRLVGEDSTIYLTSEVAPTRIRRLLPKVQMVFMLREPVSRAYSAYWHLVSTGRTSMSFERALIHSPHIIPGSSYLRPLDRYFQLFGRERVKVVLFEDFVANPQASVDSVTDFLGAPRFSIPSGSWSNKTYYPTLLPLTLGINRIGRIFTARRQINHLDSRREPIGLWSARADRNWRRFVTRPSMRSMRKPPMKPETRTFLAHHFSERNRGLSDLLERDLSQIWQGFTG